MGLDIFLGIVVLLAGLRGWFRGFWTQAIRIGGAVACVYMAAPVRDAIYPFAADHLGSMEPDILRRLLWWASAVASFVVVTGLANSLVTMVHHHRRREGLSRHRGDQSAGVLLGAVKGGLVALAVASGIARYSSQYIQNGGWFGEQVQSSRVLVWVHEHRPTDRLWESEPVQRFVDVVRTQGIDSLEATDTPGPLPLDRDRQPVRTAQRPAPLEVPPDSATPAKTEEQEIRKALSEVFREIEQLNGRPDSSR